MFIAINSGGMAQMFAGNDPIKPLLGVLPNDVACNRPEVKGSHAQKFGKWMGANQRRRNFSDAPALQLGLRVGINWPQGDIQQLIEYIACIVLKSCHILFKQAGLV